MMRLCMPMYYQWLKLSRNKVAVRERVAGTIYILFFFDHVFFIFLLYVYAYSIINSCAYTHNIPNWVHTYIYLFQAE